MVLNKLSKHAVIVKFDCAWSSGYGTTYRRPMELVISNLLLFSIHCFLPPWSSVLGRVLASVRILALFGVRFVFSFSIVKFLKHPLYKMLGIIILRQNNGMMEQWER